jgi:meso-butanediol dehydrogenase/(S,S)-butanediol dehydrogenase/diacetyl reductase
MTNARTVLVTGGARGIGRGISKSFLQAGHNVMIADLGPEPSDEALDPGWTYELSSEIDMAATVHDLSRFGTVHYTPLDVTSNTSCEAAVEATQRAFGRIDVLVNNAGILDSGFIDEFTEAQWDKIFNVNVKGIFLMTRATLKSLRKSGDAAIINIASIAGKRGSARLSAYCGSKFAAVGITQSLAIELASDGIRVNAICPGMVDTAMWLDHLMANEGKAAFVDRMNDLIPLGRPQTVEDMGQAAVYLATALNVSGIALNVAGGHEMN